LRPPGYETCVARLGNVRKRRLWRCSASLGQLRSAQVGKSSGKSLVRKAARSPSFGRGSSENNRPAASLPEVAHAEPKAWLCPIRGPAAFGRPSDLPLSLTAGLALVRQPPFALHRTVDRVSIFGEFPARSEDSVSGWGCVPPVSGLNRKRRLRPEGGEDNLLGAALV
jgi:hypothetical protein